LFLNNLKPSIAMPVPIARPPWTTLGKKLESTFRKALFDFKMLDECSNKVAIALSGGKDLYAIHVNGEFSCGAGVNENYLKTICEEIDVPFITRESTQKLETLECYSCSRERRRLLFEAAKEVGAQTIAFGHHRDDHAQTILMNLLHKGEFAGNLPKIHMQEYGVTIIRPLIYIAEQDIRTFAQQQGFARIMCRCPVGQNSMRKQVDQLLKEIESLFPHARENIARAGLIYGSQKAALP
jgi:tRNA(Ile)-lysidine synthase TilS/MesJ